jgi:hypothetical protein
MNIYDHSFENGWFLNHHDWSHFTELRVDHSTPAGEVRHGLPQANGDLRFCGRELCFVSWKE